MSELLMKCIDLEKSKNGLIKKWGYKHPEKLYEEETYRTNFRRQRDRILYTGGFRRLQDKTQVISAMKSGDHRTRLTHTLEVEQIAISLSDALGLNSDLVSAIACGHDVGHTPFGHAVERALNKKLKKQGGFSHAVQSVKYLYEKMRKDKAPKEVEDLQDIIFEGILKHDTDVYVGDYDNRQWDCSQYELNEAGTLEMQVVYWADKIAYLTHDFEDFYRTEIYLNARKKSSDLDDKLKTILANLIPEKPKIKDGLQFFETRDLIRNIIAQLIAKSEINIESNMTLDPQEMRVKTTRLIREEERKQAAAEAKKEKEDSAVEENYVEYLEVSKIKELEAQLEDIKQRNDKDQQKLIESTIKTIKRIKKDAYMNSLMINFTGDYRNYFKDLRNLLDEYYILSPEIKESDAKAEKIANYLFEYFVETPSSLPLNFQCCIKDNDPDGTNSIERIVADYIASMTDRYAEVIYTDLNAIGGNYDY